MKRLLLLMAASEGLTGLILFVSPALVTRLLFGAEVAGAGVAVSRLAGISLVALGVACWPRHDTFPPFLGMLTYGLLAVLYLAWVGLNGSVGMLLWPAVAVHAGLSVLLVWAWRKERRGPGART